jgi:hypothetical protein
MSRALIILDFDRTIFKPDFYRQFIDLMTRHGLPAETATKMKNSLDDTSQSVQLLTEVEAAGISEEQARSLAMEELGHDRFLYPDVLPFLDSYESSRIVILTTAAGPVWQSLKLDLCPSLSRFKRVIIAGNKGDHILSHLRYGPGTVSLNDLPYDEDFSAIHLIDDRIEPLRPLIGKKLVTLWHLERPDSKYKGGADSPDIREIVSLEEVTIS